MIKKFLQQMIYDLYMPWLRPGQRVAVWYFVTACCWLCLSGKNALWLELLIVANLFFAGFLIRNVPLKSGKHDDR